MTSGWRDAVIRYVAQAAKPPEKFGHQARLYALTRQIGEGLTYDDDIVFAAAWLHDIGVFIGQRPEDPNLLSTWDHVAYAMRRTPGLLEEFGFETGKIPAVVDAIRTHRASTEPLNIESTILRDADILEQLGAVGVLRAVCKIGRDTRYRSFTDTNAVLREALQTLPEKLLLPRSKEVARPKIRLLRTFLRAVGREAGSDLF